MRRDASSLAAGTVLEADVVVVGSGPLGTITALELANAGHRVLLAESGRSEHDEAQQRLADTVAPEGDPFHAESELTMRRMVGGTSALWGGRCLPYDPADFEARPAVPDALWPIAHEDMAAYLPRACRWFVCGDATFNAREIPGLRDRDLVPGLPDGDVRSTDLERWSLPTRFGAQYGAALDEHERIDLVTGLTCVEVVTTEDGTAVDHLAFRAPDGSEVTARASHHVLATGGLEATRLLMVSDRRHPGGLGNQGGHLGRWYMDHVEARIARLHLSTLPDETIYSHERDPDGVYVRRRFTFSTELLCRENQPNAAVWLVNPQMGDASHGSGILSGVYLTLRSPLGRFLLAEGIRRMGLKTTEPPSIRAHLRNIVRDLVPATRFAISFTYARFLRRGRKAPGFFIKSASNVYPLNYHAEHLPHWESRVELSDERDALGVRRLRTHIHFSEEDVAAVRSAMERIDAHVRGHGVGHLEYLHADRVAEEQAIRSGLLAHAGYHQAGTTRMSAAPEDGVVDENLTVHGTTNLHVAATSVLPTSGQANPTLTGGALAIRLADRLSAELRSG